MRHFLENLNETRAFDLAEAHDAVSLLRDQIVHRSRDCDPSTPCIVGQEKLIDGLIMALILGEHCLIEGYPGLAKTELSKTMANMLGLVFRRIQFTPDMLPSDLISRERLQMVNGHPATKWEPGPIFTNVLLADEINRASSKLQSALLEATEERQVTTLYEQRMLIRPKSPVDEEELLRKYGPFFGSDPIPEGQLQHFMLLATMNPIEQEGVFPLSEAQIDRFAFKLVVDYPPGPDLEEISKHAFEQSRLEHAPSADDGRNHVKTLYFLSHLRRMLIGKDAQARWLVDQDLRRRCEWLINFSHLRPLHREHDDAGLAFAWAPPPGVKQDELLAQLSLWSASKDRADQLRAEQMLTMCESESYPEVLSGSSPRGLLKLVRAIHAHAFLRGRFLETSVEPKWEDVRAVAPEVLRHRIRISAASLSMRAEADSYIAGLLQWLDK
ncbi:MAG TPA: AAA family ATPase [Candidatus Sulfotelmatobacter sp.]